MIELIREGVSPLDITIKKWQDIVDGKGINYGIYNCALCYLFNEMPETEHDCMLCPVYSVTEELYCKGTPYQEFNKHIRACDECSDNFYAMEGKQYCIEALKIAKKELEFLKYVKTKI